MNKKQIIIELQKIIKYHSGCMCGWTESCENCNSYSRFNLLKEGINKIINKALSIKENPIKYGESITLKYDYSDIKKADFGYPYVKR